MLARSSRSPQSASPGSSWRPSYLWGPQAQTPVTKDPASPSQPPLSPQRQSGALPSLKLPGGVPAALCPISSSENLEPDPAPVILCPRQRSLFCCGALATAPTACCPALHRASACAGPMPSPGSCPEPKLGHRGLGKPPLTLYRAQSHLGASTWGRGSKDSCGVSAHQEEGLETTRVSHPGVCRGAGKRNEGRSWWAGARTCGHPHHERPLAQRGGPGGGQPAGSRKNKRGSSFQDVEWVPRSLRKRGVRRQQKGARGSRTANPK